MRVFVGLFLCTLLFSAPSAIADSIPKILILASVDEVTALFKSEGFWGPVDPQETLMVPPLLTVVTVKEWKHEAAALPVSVKKDLFYRSMLPLILYSNDLIAGQRVRLSEFSRKYTEFGALNQQDSADFLALARHYKLLGDEDAAVPSKPKMEALLAELMLRVDSIPPALALGQGAYESGYGTSRFALEGNAFFGQWTYGGKGMTPKEKRASKGNYGVAAYAWPLDSVESYMLNLNTHNAYAGLRKMRAELRASGRKVTGHDLTASLDRYSERGQEYVDTLRGIMRVNELAVADNAELRAGPMVLLVSALGSHDAEVVAEEIDALRASGELQQLIESMGIDLK